MDAQTQRRLLFQSFGSDGYIFNMYLNNENTYHYSRKHIQAFHKREKGYQLTWANRSRLQGLGVVNSWLTFLQTLTAMLRKAHIPKKITIFIHSDQGRYEPYLTTSNGKKLP